MRPPFIKLGGEENFQEYQAEFDNLFPSGLSTDVLGYTVIFTRDRCHHICFKPEDTKWNKGAREVWRQDRAERIAWIYAALTNPVCICQGARAWLYMFEVERDSENHGELFVAVTDEVTTRNVIHFRTAYTVSYQEWLRYRSVRPWIYPAGSQPPTKTMKSKAKKKPELQDIQEEGEAD